MRWLEVVEGVEIHHFGVITRSPLSSGRRGNLKRHRKGAAHGDLEFNEQTASLRGTKSRSNLKSRIRDCFVVVTPRNDGQNEVQNLNYQAIIIL